MKKKKQPDQPVSVDGTWDGKRVVLDSDDDYRREVARLELGIGERVTVTVGRPEDMRKLWQLRHLMGHIYEPVASYENCGHTKLELHEMAKAMFMPEGKASTRELTYDEMDEFIKHAERWLRTDMPEAFEAFDAMSLASCPTFSMPSLRTQTPGKARGWWWDSSHSTRR